MSGSFAPSTAGIQAALPAQSQQNPLQMLSTFQGIQNQQVQNKLYQQDLLNRQQELQNLQLTNTTGQLANTKTIQGMASGVAWMLYTDPNLNYQRANDGINLAEGLGYPSSQLEKLRQTITPDMSPDQIRPIFRNAAMYFTPPDTQQRMMNPGTTTLKSGLVDYPAVVPQVGDLQGRPAGVPVLAWPANTGIGGAQSGIQQVAPPGWQQGVTPGGGTEQVPSPALNPFGNPIILPSSGGSGGTVAPPTPAVAGGPVAPAPAQSAAPPPAQGAPNVTTGGLVRTALSPEEQAANAQSAQKFQAETAFDSGYAQSNQQNLGALEALRNADTGKGSTERNWAKGFVLSVFGPDYAKRLGIDENKVDWFDIANKYLTARQANLSGPAATDFARHERELSNPSVETQNQAAVHMHLINTGFDNMREAAFRSYMALPQNQGAGVTDPNVTGGFQRYWSNYMNSHDYRAFMPENRNERSATIDGLQPGAETDNYGASLQDANAIGVKVTP